MRRSLRKRLPTAHEVVYEYRDWFVISYSPNEHGYDGVLAIRGSADGVKLYFNRGKGLPDPAKVLRGSGTQVRFIQMEGAPTLWSFVPPRPSHVAGGAPDVPSQPTTPPETVAPPPVAPPDAWVVPLPGPCNGTIRCNAVVRPGQWSQVA